MSDSHRSPDIEPDQDPEPQDPSTIDSSEDIVADGLAQSESLDEDGAIPALRSLMEYLVDNLIEEPEQVDVQFEQRGQAVAIQLRVREEELGRIIGRGGRIAKAIRAALMIAGSRHHVRVSLNIES